MVVIIRRPHSLLKSPSADSESSDPIQRPLLLKTDSTSSSSMGTMERRRRLIAARYRTDSETTDEQCIPESISETHDSAVESAEDIEEDDKSPNCEVVPAINLEVQSSTESDKTVLSLRHNSADQLSSVPNSPFGSSIGSSGLAMFSRPKLSLNLPEIIVEPCSPPATSPSAESSPTSAALSDQPVAVTASQFKKESSSSTTSSTSSITLGKICLYKVEDPVLYSAICKEALCHSSFIKKAKRRWRKLHYFREEVSISSPTRSSCVSL